MQAVHGNSHHRPHLSQTDSTPQVNNHPHHGKPGKTDGSVPTTVDQVDLSPEAQLYLTGFGKPGHSTAQMARMAISDHPELGSMQFGKVVSALNHGTLNALIATAEPEVPEGEIVDPLAGNEVVDGMDVASTDTESTDGMNETEVTGTVPASNPVEGDVPVATDAVEEILETEVAEGDIPVVIDPDAEILTTVDQEDTTVEEDTITVAPPSVEQPDTEAALLDLIDGAADDSETDSTEQGV